MRGMQLTEEPEHGIRRILVMPVVGKANGGDREKAGEQEGSTLKGF